MLNMLSIKILHMLLEKHETQFMEYSKKIKYLNYCHRADYWHISEQIMIIIISARSVCFSQQKQ